MIDWAPFVEIVRDNSKFVLTTHVRPDCDGIGSALALAEVLRGMGKEVEIAVPFTTPPTLAFLLDDTDLVPRRVPTEITADEIEQSDVLIILDTSSWAQLSTMADVVRETKLPKIVIDHHAVGDDIGATMFADSTAEATGRLVTDVVQALGLSLTPRVASYLFAAIATDTGWFRFSSTTSDTYRTIAKLVDAGAKPDLIYQQLYEKESISRLRLIGRAMGRVETDLSGRLIHTYLTRDDFTSAGAHPSESEDVINMTLTVAGTKVAIIFVEQPEGGFKLSFRSRCEIDCAQLAKTFGGGGHMKAAGAFIEKPLEEVREMVLTEVRTVMRAAGLG